ncbi:MAG: cohesin domain-containing protein, partial [Parcubacteria group bacterium]
PESGDPGTQFARSANGENWEPIWPRAFGDSNNYWIATMMMFNDNLYAGTFNGNGAQLWRSTDGMNWTQTNQNGFGNDKNFKISSLVSFSGYLYATTQNIKDGTQLWRSTDGMNWTQTNQNGFGNRLNSDSNLIVFKNSLYAGTFNADGMEMWTSSDGTTWSQVDPQLQCSDSTTYNQCNISNQLCYQGELFKKGDLNNDEVRNLADIVLLVGIAFRDELAPNPFWVGDINDDDRINLLDVVELINHVFRNGPEPTCTQALVRASTATSTLQLVQQSTSTITLQGTLSAPAQAMQLNLTYDPTQLTFKSVTKSTATSNLDLNSSSKSGQYTVGLLKNDGSQTFTSGSLLTITYTGNPASLKIANPIVVDPQSLSVKTTVSPIKLISTKTNTNTPKTLD